MKRFMGTLMMSSLFFIGASAFAAAPLSGGGFNGAKIEASNLNGGIRLQSNSDTNRNCWGWTDCADGRRISCWSTGDACQWSYVAGVSVTCTGQGSDGSYASHSEYCY